MEIVIKFNHWIIELLLTFRARISLFAFQSSNPLMLCLLLIVLALLVGATTGVIFIKWITYSLVLIFLGGIIIIFIYITRLAGSEKFVINPSTAPLITLLALSSYALLIHPTQNKKENFISHLFMRTPSYVLWTLVVFLLATLLIVVKIAESFKGALIKFV